jgi:hypothetical protein
MRSHQMKEIRFGERSCEAEEDDTLLMAQELQTLDQWLVELFSVHTEEGGRKERGEGSEEARAAGGSHHSKTRIISKVPRGGG